jgi:hypothetical protein
VDFVAVAALDLAVQHALAGLGPEVGVQDVARDAAQALALDQARERRTHAPQGVELAVAESAGAVGGKAHRVDRPGGELERHDDVVGHAERAQLGEHQELLRALHGGEAPPDLARAVEHRVEGVAQVLVGLQVVVHRVDLLDRRDAALPDVAPARHDRVQRAHEHPHAQQRQPALEQPLAQLPHDVLWLGRAARAVDDPVDHRGNLARRGHRSGFWHFRDYMD